MDNILEGVLVWWSWQEERKIYSGSPWPSKMEDFRSFQLSSPWTMWCCPGGEGTNSTAYSCWYRRNVHGDIGKPDRSALYMPSHGICNEHFSNRWLTWLMKNCQERTAMTYEYLSGSLCLLNVSWFKLWPIMMQVFPIWGRLKCCNYYYEEEFSF